MSCVMLVAFVLAIGCMGDDKFSGQWVGLCKSSWDGSNAIAVYKIQKNGESYIIDSQVMYLPSLVGMQVKEGKRFPNSSSMAMGLRNWNHLSVDWYCYKWENKYYYRVTIVRSAY